MAGFTKLETAALHAIFAETAEWQDGLTHQLQRATVTSRENSGAGFFTYIEVPQDAPGVSCPRVLGREVHARVEGIAYGFGFVLFMEDGRLHLLEGYSVGGDDTASLGFGELAFEVCKLPTVT